MFEVDFLKMFASVLLDKALGVCMGDVADTYELYFLICFSDTRAVHLFFDYVLYTANTI